MDLQGRFALVTGAGQGVGRGIALALGRAGASVVLTGRSLAKLEAVAVFLASDAARYITGSLVLADGGRGQLRKPGLSFSALAAAAAQRRAPPDRGP